MTASKVKKGARSWGLGARKKQLYAQKSLAPSPQSLLAWYDEHRRILPWRALPGATIDPYRVWLSEIMLQQTTVGAVGPYFQKFITRWPTIRHLARARRGDILKMWARLGYYRRAHLLHDCAKVICRDFNGCFPQTEKELLELPGFGPYTAAAVAAIAFDQRANVVDGNVERVMARLFGIETPLPQAKAELRTAAAKLLPEAQHGDYAQALMDLGATICTPKNPKCMLCPISKSCRARARGIAEQLPRRLKAKAKPVRRAIAFFVINSNGEVLLRQRPRHGLLGGMMEIPSSTWQEGAMPKLDSLLSEAPLAAKWRLAPGYVRHVFTHFELDIAVAIGKVAGSKKAQNARWVPIQKLNNEALPSVMLKIVRHAESKL